MAVSVLAAPESLWGYPLMTAAYDEAPCASWDRIHRRLRELYPRAEEADVVGLIGRRPEE